MTYRLTTIALGAEETKRGLEPLGEMIGFFPEGHAVRACAERCPTLLEIVRAQKPCADEDSAMDALRSYTRGDYDPYKISVADAIRDVVEPERHDRPDAIVRLRRPQAAAVRRSGLRLPERMVT